MERRWSISVAARWYIGRPIQELYPVFEYTLTTMTGIDITTATNMLAEIGDISRFASVDKLAKFAGVAPVRFSSAGKGNDSPRNRATEGYRRFFISEVSCADFAIQMIQVSTKGVPRNTIFRDYFLRRVKDGKNKQQVLICIARRLVNIVYGMLKNKTEYKEPNTAVKNQ